MGGRGGGSPGAKTSAPSAPVAAPVAPESSLQKQIDNAFEDRKGTGNYMMFSELREALPPMSDAEWAKAMRDLAVRSDARVIPIANLKSLSDADRRDAVRLGGEQKHAFTLAKG